MIRFEISLAPTYKDTKSFVNKKLMLFLSQTNSIQMNQGFYQGKPKPYKFHPETTQHDILYGQKKRSTEVPPFSFLPKNQTLIS